MPRQQPPSDERFARAAELRATGAAWGTVVNGPTVAAHGIGRGATGTRADLLARNDVVDVRALHSHIDRCRVAESFENNLMNLLEPEGRSWGLFTPWHADDRNARRKKNPAFALFRRPIGPDFEPVWAEKWPRVGLVGPVSNGAPPAFAFKRSLHDDGPKTVLGKSGAWDGTDVIRIVLEQPACARVLARKLYRHPVALLKRR